MGAFETPEQTTCNFSVGSPSSSICLRAASRAKVQCIGCQESPSPGPRVPIEVILPYIGKACPRTAGKLTAVCRHWNTVVSTWLRMSVRKVDSTFAIWSFEFEWPYLQPSWVKRFPSLKSLLQKADNLRALDLSNVTGIRQNDLDLIPGTNFAFHHSSLSLPFRFLRYVGMPPSVNRLAPSQMDARTLRRWDCAQHTPTNWTTCRKAFAPS